MAHFLQKLKAKFLIYYRKIIYRRRRVEEVFFVGGDPQGLTFKRVAGGQVEGV
jgi:hypothetical protein